MFNFFKELPCSFSPWLHFNFPTSNAQGFQFLHTLSNACYFLWFIYLFDNSHPNECELVPVLFLKQIPDTAPFHLQRCQEEQLVLPRRDKGLLSHGGISISTSVSFWHEGLSAFLT